ncbi:hypothetical protein BDN72DRAFT_342811 [Pluteus cervinus]|uniref:Uncharacterized protein n=1 Tax=Pluteus cervinus TaxID=181527 RepID=A0ACD3B2P3_9AGAR|nr:hypothetical protein BDN72DRAFT_342811 [Pluteus cervinus]
MCDGAAFDSAERADPPRCHPETRTTILSPASSWVNDIEAVCFYLWITGWAGVGKSAILQTLAEEFAQKKRLAASFFFFQASRGRKSTRGFIATIAYQLMESVPGARETILRKISHNPAIFDNKSFNGQWQTLVVDTLCDCRPPAPSPPMLIVVDGVDEIISREEQKTLLEAILWSTPRLHPAGYKLLIASRPEEQIEAIFKNPPLGFSKSNRVNLDDDESTRADIGLFLRDTLSRIRERKPHLSAPTARNWPAQSTIDCLVKKASGQFIYAKTIVRFVEDFNGDPQDVLQVIMSRDPHLKSFKELDYLYLLLMERIQTWTPKTNRGLLHHLLVCIYMHLGASTYPHEDLYSFP